MNSLCPREDFPPLVSGSADHEDIVYLDSAATSLTPVPVIRAISAYYETSSANIHRGKHALSESASEAYEECRVAVARFLRVSHREVVLTRNTTHGLNILARGMGLGPQDRVLVAADNHHSALLPWQRSGCTLERIGVGSDAQVSLEALRAALAAGPAPRVVVLTHCSNVTGLHLDISPWVTAAREAGAIVVLDAAQSAPHRELRPDVWGVDAVAFSAHKMLGPTGLGVLWATSELLQSLDPLEIGGGTVDWVDDDFRWRDVPHRLEAGTPDIAASYGFAAALEYLKAAGMASVAEHDRDLGRVLTAHARERGWRFLGDQAPDDVDRTATLSLFWPGMSRSRMDVLARALSDSYGVMGRSGFLCSQPLVTEVAAGPVLRLSAYVYSSEEDVVQAFSALDELGAAGLLSRG